MQRAGQQHTRKIQRIGGSDVDLLSGSTRTAQMPQQIHRFRPPELLTHITRNESSPTNLAPRLHPAVDREQIAPGGRESFPRQNIAEHNAPAIQKQLGEKLGIGLV